MASDKSRVTKRILDYFQEKMKEWTLQNASGSSVTEDRVSGIEADIEALETSMDDMDGAISGEGGLSERVQALEDAGTGGGDVTLADLGITASADSINKIDDIRNDLISVMDELYYTYNAGKSLVHYSTISVTLNATATEYQSFDTYINKSSYKVLGCVAKLASPCAVSVFTLGALDNYQIRLYPQGTTYGEISGEITILYSV